MGAYPFPFRLTLPLTLAFALAGTSCPQARPRLLVFSKVASGGYYHQVIPQAAGAVIKLGGETGFDADSTSDARAFTRDNLARYQAVFFNHTYGEVFDTAQQNAFQDFIRKGGGFAGIHASCYAELEWPWYKGLVGAYFKSHPAIAPATLIVEDRTHLSTSGLPAKWTRTDEWYDFDSNPRASVHVLLSIDEKSYPGGTMGADHPMAWYHAYDGGRAWFSALGHTPESYTEPYFLGHLRGGIEYALGMSPVGIVALERKAPGTIYSLGGEAAFGGSGDCHGCHGLHGFHNRIGFLPPEGRPGTLFSADGALLGQSPGSSSDGAW